MKTHYSAFRLIVPVLLMLASFTSRAQLLNNCSFGSQVDTFSNSVTFVAYPDTNLVVSSIAWNFGDNTSSTVTSPTHVYSSSGTYSVYLAVQYTNGDSCFYSENVNVHDTTHCQLYVVIDTVNGCNPNQVGAMAVPVGGTPPYTYSWNNGATVNTLCGLVPGIYTVVVTDASGCSGTASYYYSSHVWNSCYFDSYVDSFTNGVSFYSYPDTTLTIAYYSWSFGDNTSSSLANPTHTFANVGTYNVFMYIEYTNGNSCYYSNTVNVHDTTRPCSLYVTLDTLNSCGGLGQYGATAVANGGTPPYTYYWSNGTNVATVCGLSAGNYTVTVADANGCSGVGYFYSPYTGNGCFFSQSFDSINNTYTFNPYTDTTLTVSSYSWNFGDGTFGTGSNPSHVYNNTSYRVTMSVVYTNGDSCSYSDSLYRYSTPIGGSYCQAYFYQYIDSANNNTFHFVDYSSYNPISWTWDFGDSTSSTLQNPVHTYAAQGTYNVCLSTVDSSGCTSSYCEQLSNIPVQNLSAYLYHQTTVTPGFPVWVYLGYYNAGTINMNGTLQYRYPAGTTISASSVAPTTNDVVNRLATFSFSNLLPASSQDIRINLMANVSLQIGTLAEDTVWVNPIAGDVNPNDNVAFVNDTVTGSWDPNAKEVSPRGEGSEGIVPMATNEVSYMIHFQNTGNGPAHTVVVVDTLDSNIDWSTVQETNASHDHVTELNGNILTVTFHNINLPDSGSNFAASQGFVMLRASLKSSLTSGTRITNTAAIYFDFNAAVMTNTVVTTLFDKTSGIGSIQHFDFAVVPNPANNVVTLRGEFDHGTTYEVINQLGEVLMTGEAKSNSTNLNISKLANGIYLVKVINGEKVGLQRLTIAR